MSAKREYSILPQGDNDFHHHVHPGKPGATAKYMCLFTVITITIVLIFAGITALTASMFYSDQVSTSFGHFWYSVEFTNGTTSTTTSADSSFTGGSKSVTASVPERNSTDYAEESEKTLSSQRHHHHIHHNRNKSDRKSSDVDSAAEDNYSTSDSDWHYGNATSGNGTLDSSEELDSNMNATATEQDIINMDEFKEKFAETMRDLEKRMENMTGIRKAEFVIPIFMLICFLTLFSIISLCCCIMMKRRDSRRRKLFGKLITDLQTGDSKTVLLNHSDLDD